jgi:hypothetical protein
VESFRIHFIFQHGIWNSTWDIFKLR